MPIELRPVGPEDVDRVVALALRAWAPVHASMAAVLGDRLDARIYPDRAAEQEHGVRAACADPDAAVSVAVDETGVLGFVGVIVDAAGAVHTCTRDHPPSAGI